jgi:uncharacterized membrane-anchored protein YhcB (DUF1043 family)
MELNGCIRCFIGMIEALMYMGIGLLTGCLIGLAVVPLVHDRAVRLTVRRIERALPNSIKEIEADKDLLRADFAMSTRRLELSNEQLRNRTASQLADLGRKSDILNQLKAQRDLLKVEVLGLKAQVAALKKRLDRDREEPKVHDVGAMLRQWIPHRVHH